MNAFPRCHVVQVVFQAVAAFHSHSLLPTWNSFYLRVGFDLYLPCPCLVAKRLYSMNYARSFGSLYISVSTAFSRENKVWVKPWHWKFQLLRPAARDGHISCWFYSGIYFSNIVFHPESTSTTSADVCVWSGGESAPWRRDGCLCHRSRHVSGCHGNTDKRVYMCVCVCVWPDHLSNTHTSLYSMFCRCIASSLPFARPVERLWSAHSKWPVSCLQLKGGF